MSGLCFLVAIASCSDGRTPSPDGTSETGEALRAGDNEHRQTANKNGATCTTSTDCNSNFCEDGVCCDTLCGGGEPNDCYSCLGAMTGLGDGTCGQVLASAHYVCRPSLGACDVAGVCPGPSLLGEVCPPDTVQPNGTVCQQAGACNSISTCNGASPVCPTANSPNGTSCGAGEICANGVCASECDIGGVLVAGGSTRPLNPCQECDPSRSTTAWSNEPDGTSCQGGVCASGACANDCFIAGTVYTATTVNPANPCQLCVPANSTTTWTNEPDGTACGNGKECSSGACTTACTINGVTYAAGAANPANACQECDPAQSTNSWSPAPNGTDCSLLLAVGVCDNSACVNDCYIAGSFYAAGATNPSNPCQVCTPGTSRQTWTNVNDGTACGAGMACSGGACAADCVISSVTYASGAKNPLNDCQECIPSASTSMWSSEPPGTTCGLLGARICDGQGNCAADCYIAGQIYAANTTNPANSCQLCNPASSETAWSNKGDGTACGTGQVCSSGTCANDCDINSVVVSSGTANPANPCEVCNPAVSTTSWSDQPVGTSCGLLGGGICDGTGSCEADCFINGTVYAAGTVDPSNRCQYCNVAASTSTWTNVPNGIICDTGETCDNGVCAAVCNIGGTVYPAGAVNPANACQTCAPATSTSAWTNDADGTACGFGRVCVSSSCVNDCVIGGVAYTAGTPNPANSCQQCAPTVSTSTWSNEPDGTTCGTNQVCVDGQCGVCTINGTTYLPGQVNPANACQVCAPGTSTTTWSNAPNGQACAGGEVCSSGACTADCYIGGKLYTPGATNPANPCQACAPGTSTTTWTNLGDGTTCGNNQVCLTGACGACVINGVTYPAGTVNPQSSCQECIPTASQTSWSTAPDGTTCPAGVCTGGMCGPSGSSSSSSGSASTGSGSASTGSGSASTGSGSASTGSGSASTGSASSGTGGGSASTGSGSASTGSGSASTGSGSASTGSASSGTGGGSASTGSGSASTGSGSASTGSGSASTGSGSASTGSASSGSGGGSASTGSGSASTGSASTGSGAGGASSGSGTGASGPNETGVVAEGGGCRCGAVGSTDDSSRWLGVSLAFLMSLSLRRRRRS